MEKIVAITGASGNMGVQTLTQIMELDFVTKVKALLLDGKRERKYAKKWAKKYGERIEIIFGNIKNINDVKELVNESDYVLNLAAVIPPMADHNPEAAKDCNITGAKNVVEAISEIKEKQPKLVHISTVAVYGNRDYKHPWGRVGDPLLPSVYDVYSETKIKGERFVLDSDIKNWAVLRQTGMLHKNMLFDNMKDGLMFHTCFNTPIEWATARDSGLLLKNLILKDSMNELEQDFWKKCYNIGGGQSCRVTGYDTFNQGFGIIGGSTEQFFKPNWNSLRNFHCMWFLDSDKLNDYFNFQNESVDDYWKEMLDTHKYFSLAKLLPPKLISKLAIERLLKDENSPAYWIKTNQEGKIKAFFGSKDNYECLSDNWENFPVLAHGQLTYGSIDYEAIRDIKNVGKYNFVLDHGYDESKPDSELDILDMQKAAEFRGGKCISEKMVKGDLYTKLEWECHDGHRFFSSPYCIIKAGHWCPECTIPEPWDFDRLSKFMPFYAQIWYDTHSKDENVAYYYEKNYKAEMKDI